MYFLLKYTARWSLLLYCCIKTATITTSEALDSTTNGFVKSGGFKAGEKHNSDLSCSKYYVNYYSHYHYLPVLSKSVKDAAIIAKFGINSFL